MTHIPRGDSSHPDELPWDWDDRTPIELDDDHWDALLPDEDQGDPLPEPGDFWIDFDGSDEVSPEFLATHGAC